jgi:hypothetical protein
VSAPAATQSRDGVHRVSVEVTYRFDRKGAVSVLAAVLHDLPEARRELLAKAGPRALRREVKTHLRLHGDDALYVMISLDEYDEDDMQVLALAEALADRAYPTLAGGSR